MLPSPNSPLLPSMYQEFTTQSLMLFLVFIGRSTGAWLRKPILFQWTSLNRFRGFDSPTLERQCHQFLTEGLPSSTGNCYASGHGLPCPVDEWTLCLFVTHFAQSVRPATIKVYLSTVCALHIQQGFPDPLVNCLQLQRVVRGIQRSVGKAGSTSLPVTDQALLLIFKAIDFSKHDHIMFWAACNPAYFGFLHSSEFTVPNLFWAVSPQTFI